MTLATMQAVLKKYSRLELATMLAELCDGQDEHDLHGMTGLNPDRCVEIKTVAHELARALYC
ncbi:MAG: hypothetical protein ACYSW8_27085 [Planctomycetota bacterium]